MGVPSRRRARRGSESGGEGEDPTQRKVLPSRSSRGTRINKLLGEEAEADEAFWGQDAWREDASDDDYSTEEEEEDVVDADFDEEEQPDEDVHDADAEDDKPQRKRAAAAQTKAYREPSARAKKARLQAVAAGSNGTEIVARQSPAGASKPPAPLVYEGPRVRRSTARKSTESSELRKRASEEAARLAAKLKRPTVDKASTRLTQAQLLAEAVRTEVENVQSLNRLEQLEEEKKAEAMTPKAPFTGQMVRYYSRVGVPKTITFLNTAVFPPLFNQTKPKKRVSTQERLEHLRREADDDSSAEGSESDEEDDNSADERDSSSTSRRTAKKKAGRVRSTSTNSAA